MGNLGSSVWGQRSYSLALVEQVPFVGFQVSCFETGVRVSSAVDRVERRLIVAHVFRVSVAGSVLYFNVRLVSCVVSLLFVGGFSAIESRARLWFSLELGLGFGLSG